MRRRVALEAGGGVEDTCAFGERLLELTGHSEALAFAKNNVVYSDVEAQKQVKTYPALITTESSSVAPI